MLSDREKVVVGTCVLVILAAVVTGCLLLFAGDGKAPGMGGLPATSGPQALLNGQSVPGLQSGSLMGQGSPQEQAALQAQALLDQQAAATDQQSSSGTQNQQSSPSGTSIAGAWLLNVEGRVYVFPSLSVTLKTDGTVSLQGASSPYVNIKSSHYDFNAASRSIEISCDCEITLPQSTTMPVTLILTGSFEPGLAKATGSFTAVSNSTPTDQGTFKLYH